MLFGRYFYLVWYVITRAMFIHNNEYETSNTSQFTKIADTDYLGDFKMTYINYAQLITV